MMRAHEIHARVGSAWPHVLVTLGIPEAVLRNRHGPCPACGGKDRFRFDNKGGRGSFYCNGCGAGDGFSLLERVYGWPFSEARQRVIEAAGLEETSDESGGFSAHAPPRLDSVPTRAIPPDRVHRLRRDRCVIENCSDAIDYFDSRDLWPLPKDCTLKAHSSVEYWHDGRRAGRYPALVADVVDVAGDLVTCHVTYLDHGKKLADHEPRKLMSPLTERIGCAVRLLPGGALLGIAEGIETALSAATLEEMPVWAALNTSLLARFEPPPETKRLLVFADRDEAGLAAACRLMERLQGRIRVEIRIPPPPAKDWNNVLATRNSRLNGEGVRP